MVVHIQHNFLPSFLMNMNINCLYYCTIIVDKIEVVSVYFFNFLPYYSRQLHCCDRLRLCLRSVSVSDCVRLRLCRVLLTIILLLSIRTASEQNPNVRSIFPIYIFLRKMHFKMVFDPKKIGAKIALYIVF